MSSHELKTSKFSFVLCTHENSDVFKPLDEIYKFGIHLKKVNILYLLSFCVTVKAVTLIFIFGRGSAISSAQEGK